MSWPYSRYFLLPPQPHPLPSDWRSLPHLRTHSQARHGERRGYLLLCVRRMQAVVVTGAGGELEGDTCSGVCCWQEIASAGDWGGRSVCPSVGE